MHFNDFNERTDYNQVVPPAGPETAIFTKPIEDHIGVKFEIRIAFTETETGQAVTADVCVPDELTQVAVRYSIPAADLTIKEVEARLSAAWDRGGHSYLQLHPLTQGIPGKVWLSSTAELLGSIPMRTFVDLELMPAMGHCIKAMRGQNLDVEPEVLKAVAQGIAMAAYNSEDTDKALSTRLRGLLSAAKHVRPMAELQAANGATTDDQPLRPGGL